MNERRVTTERYYDCLQCAEQCRHVLLTSDGSGNYNNNNTINANTKHSDSGAIKSMDRAFQRANGIRIESKFGNARSKKNCTKNRMPPTPARKRSSLARPVRVHDSFVQPRRSIGGADLSQHQQSNSEDFLTEPESIWSIRYRLEEMLESAIPKIKKENKKRRKLALRKRSTQSVDGKHGFKDTDRLLKVLSVNHVDQDNGYNVKRCSVM